MPYARGAISSRAASVLAQMKGILEPRQRQAALADQLTCSPDGAPWWIHEWIVRSRGSEAAVLVALDTLAVVLTRPGLISYPARAALYEGAKQSKLDHVGFLLLESPPHGDEFEVERPLDPRGRPLTLGERKALARGHQRDVLEKLTADPHPDVVSVLLDNPRLTEREVLRITSRRPVAPETLLTVVLSERFRPRPAVRRSLCLNPHLPVPVAARLMTNLLNADLKALGADVNMPAQLRLHARTLVQLRATDPG